MARKILLADDSVTAQNMGRKILADAGYEVITVNNGSAALKKIAESRPDIIVLDVYMPGYSGLEVCQRLKETGDTSRIPILLTVGKLEPFKPEEARRARADGFIIKPFEASELLSALAKLEDRMVPSTESSKPGRFARAIAAVEEGRYDKSTGAEEDSGWKNRISFPTKKKEKEKSAPEERDESDIYNPVNKDLRTVVDHSPAKPVAPEERVDLGAVAPEGLPKDVTAEEIAALAAAAAQIQGKIEEAKSAESKTSQSQTEQVKSPGPVAEAKSEAVRDTEPATHPVPESVAEIPAAAANPVEQPVTRAELQEKQAPEPPRELEVVQPRVDLSAVTPADVMAAIDGLEGTALSSTPEPSSDRFNSSDSATPAEAEPITMAVAAGAESAFVPVRWSAVPVSLAPEEAAVILEEEMRKAYAASAEVASAPAQATEPASEMQTASSQSTATEQAPAPADSTQPVPPTAEPEVVQASTRANETTEPGIAAATETSHFAALPPIDQTESGWREPVETKVQEEVKLQEAKIEETSVAQVAEPPVAEVVAPSLANPSFVDQALTSIATEQQRIAEPSSSDKYEAAVAAPSSVHQNDTIAERSDAIEPIAQATPAEETGVNRTAEELEQAAERAVAGPRDTQNQESEIAATTAAAWASWRRTRESGGPGQTSQSNEKSTDDRIAALRETAMAVAAGAEKAPQDGESPEIANIVDSVLADLRPKIVEEISKKLKKKTE